LGVDVERRSHSLEKRQKMVDLLADAV